MFRPLDPAPQSLVPVTLDGRPALLPAGANLAAALLAAGFTPFRRTPVSGAPRLPFCMMGVCFDCLAQIDGQANRQTCLETVREGMVIARQEGAV